MASFDIAGARQAGYSDAEITGFLGERSGFDVEGARNAGYSDQEILAKLSGTSAPQAAGGNPVNQVNAPTQPKKASTLDRVMAFPAAVNKAAYAYVPGIPVDTAANVLDLAKAGIGYATSKVTGKAPPAWTEPMDRGNVIGSSDWIANRINAGAKGIGARSPIDNPAPQDDAARIIYSGGLLGGSAIVPNPNAKIRALDQVRNIGMGTAGGLLSGVVAEQSPEWAGVAGMAPQMAAAAAAGATRQAFRGGEAGRRKMEQRIQDFKNAGVDQPSAGLATGNGLVQGVENLLSLTPGSVGVFERSKQRMIDGLQSKTNQIRDSISPLHGASETGISIQDDLKGAFKDRINTTFDTLNDRVARAIGTNTRVPVDESIRVSKDLTTPVSGAVATSSNFINGKIAKIHQDLNTDSGGTPVQTTTLPNGRPVPIIAPTTPQGLPFSALKQLRTRIGQETVSKSIIGTPQEGEYKQLYGAMSDDMRNAADAADLRSGNPSMPATTALNRSNDFYSTAMDKVGALNTLANRNTPESAFNSVATSLQSGPTTFARTRNAVTPETRQKMVATVIDDLGRAKAGQQNVDGEVWSSRTFLTNWNKLDPQSKTELFKRLPGGKAHGENLNDIAKATDMIGQSSKVWANPSGTGAALAARGAFGAIGVGAFLQPVMAAGTAASLVGANAASRLLLSPIFVNWLAKAPKIGLDKAADLNKAQSYAQRLVINAQMSKDAQLQHDVAEYLKSVQETVSDSRNAANK